MKKILWMLTAFLLFIWVALADETPTWMTITLNPWWNVVSTPTVLSNILFSNWWDWISFMYLDGSQRKNVAITPSNVSSVFKPLEWFLVKNNNSDSVNMVLYYDMNIDISWVMREKQVRAWWNFLWVVKTSNPFENIVSTAASIIVDFSKKFYNWASISYMKQNPTEYEIWKAYWVFADANGIYWWLTTFSDNIDCTEPSIASLCAVDSVDCPKKCQTSYNEVTWIKLQNTNLGNVSVARWSQNVLISEWTILVEKSVVIPSFSITATAEWIESLIFIANWIEYTASTTDNLTFTFENVQIAKSWKVGFKANIDDNAVLNTNISLSTINHSTIQSAKFVDNNTDVGDANILWSISFSQISITVPKAAIENTISSNVVFPINNIASETVFSGVYTAKKWDIYLNHATISKTSGTLPNGTQVRFTLFINDNEFDLIADHPISFSNIKVAAWDTVNIRIDAEVEAVWDNWYLPTFVLTIWWEDDYGDAAWDASDTLASMRIEDLTTVNVSSISKSNVFLSTKNALIAEFRVSAADADETTLEEISFSLDVDGVPLSPDNVKLTIGGDEQDASSSQNFVYEPNEVITSSANAPWGKIITIYIKNSVVGTVTLSNLQINSHNIAKEFKRHYDNAIVYIADQEDCGWTTRFVLGLEKKPNIDNITVSNVKLYTAASTEPVLTFAHEISNWDIDEVIGTNEIQFINKISYDINDGVNTRTVEISKSDYVDYFKVGDTYAKIFKY